MPVGAAQGVGAPTGTSRPDSDSNSRSDSQMDQAVFKTTVHVRREVGLPDIPVAIIAGIGHTAAGMLAGRVCGKGDLTLQLLDLGDVLAAQLRDPAGSQTAAEMLRELGDPHFFRTVHDLASIDPNAHDEHGLNCRRWADTIVNQPGGMADQFPHLHQQPDTDTNAVARGHQWFGVTWALGMLARLLDDETTQILDEIVRLRNARLAEQARDRQHTALAVAA